MGQFYMTVLPTWQALYNMYSSWKTASDDVTHSIRPRSSKAWPILTARGLQQKGKVLNTTIKTAEGYHSIGASDFLLMTHETHETLLQLSIQYSSRITSIRYHSQSTPHSSTLTIRFVFFCFVFVSYIFIKDVITT